MVWGWVGDAWGWGGSVCTIVGLQPLATNLAVAFPRQSPPAHANTTRRENKFKERMYMQGGHEDIPRASTRHQLRPQQPRRFLHLQRALPWGR